MSDLHKQFLKRIKKQEQSLGLSLLQEEDDTPSSDFNTPPISHFNRPISRSRSKFNRSNETHDLILQNYNKVKQDTFPVIDFWKDESTGVKFRINYIPPKTPDSSIVIFCHGAGSSSMTFCKIAQTIKSKDNTIGLLLFDIRGHGESESPNVVDYSLKTLTSDFKFIIDNLHKLYDIKSAIYLVGHSLGGSILTNYLMEYPKDNYNIKGLVMLDIVEETAISSLGAMSSFLERLPPKFISYQQAIDWHIKATSLLKNPESAKLSVPDLFLDNGEYLTWKTDLKETQPFWDTWFKKLSKNFVECGKDKNIAKLLILAGHETLDTSLIIGQMQGKYQLIVFNNPMTGHFIHEDIPNEVGVSLIDFMKRNDSPEEYMKKELGFTPKWGGKIHQ